MKMNNEGGDVDDGKWMMVIGNEDGKDDGDDGSQFLA